VVRTTFFGIFQRTSFFHSRLRTLDGLTRGGRRRSEVRPELRLDGPQSKVYKYMPIYIAGLAADCRLAIVRKM